MPSEKFDYESANYAFISALCSNAIQWGKIMQSPVHEKHFCISDSMGELYRMMNISVDHKFRVHKNFGPTITQGTKARRLNFPNMLTAQYESAQSLLLTPL